MVELLLNPIYLIHSSKSIETGSNIILKLNVTLGGFGDCNVYTTLLVRAKGTFFYCSENKLRLSVLRGKDGGGEHREINRIPNPTSCALEGLSVYVVVKW